MEGIVSSARRNDEARSTRAHIASLLRESIIEGRIEPGARLGQEQLRDEFGVSSAPVREALRQLESEGLVFHQPNRGTFVAEITADELLGVLLPIRLHLERYAAHRAVKNTPAGLYPELEDIVTAMYSAAARGDLRSVTEADVAFHNTLVNSAGSGHVTQIWSGIESRLRVLLNRLGQPEERLQPIADAHRALLEVLCTGNVERIDAELHEHIIASNERLVPPTTGSLMG
ncbi:GntR family transcriptional regulator [Streptomyces asiaticus]